MQKALGWAVLALGVGGLGWYGAKNNAVRMETRISDAASAVTLDTLHSVDTEIQGRDITVSGIADTEAERDQILAALQDVPGRRVIRDDLEVLPVAAPFEMISEKTREGVVTLSGAVPSEVDRAVLATELGQAAETLTLSSGAPAGWMNAAGQGLSAMSALEAGKLTVSDKTLTLQGTAKTPIELDMVTASLEGLPADFSQSLDIDLLDDGSPFNTMINYDGAAYSVSGKYPPAFDIADLAAAKDISETGNGIKLGYLPEETGQWTNVVRQGVSNLAVLENGQLSVQDKQVMISGLARTTAEGAAAETFADLPEGYSVASDFTYIDDGTPPSYTVNYSAETGAMVNGKVPAGLTNDKISSALGLQSVAGDPTQALSGQPDADLKTLGDLRGWMGSVEAFTLSKDGDAQSLNVTAASGADLDQLTAGFADIVGGASGVTISATASNTQDGATRTNAFSQMTEVFSAGYWLPVSNFEASEAECNAQGKSQIEKAKVNFVTGSATIDSKSMNTINAVTSIIAKCVSDAGLFAEIGGHTDAQGSDALNLELSQKRADAVVAALVARGVPAVAMTSVGYGESTPIADNETEEGRAANRRTTLLFTPEKTTANSNSGAE